MTMNLLVICSVFLFLHECHTLTDDKDGDCYIDGVSDWNIALDIKEILDDTKVGQEIFKGNYKNIKSSESSCTSKDCFFGIKLNETEKILSILSNDELLKIDGNYNRVDSPKEIMTTITLHCSTGDKSLSFKVSIKDINSHEPSFEKTSYEYLLPMPIPPKIDLMQFGSAIKAQDLDFSNKDITFSSDFDGLKYTTTIQEGSDVEYPYILRLEFTKVSRLLKNTTFTLIATDSGSPTKLSKSIPVTFNIDEANSEPYVPKFIQPSFMYKYNAHPLSISAIDQEVTLEENKDGVKCKLVGDLAQYFDEPTRKGEIIEISLGQQFPDDIIEKTVATISVNCYSDSNYPSMADVTILFPEDAKVHTVFSKTTYSAQYSIQNNDQKVVMKDSITVENYIDDVTIQVDTYAKYFEIVQSRDGSWLLSKKSGVNLDDSELQQTSMDVVISLILQTTNKILDKAVITLLLPNGETRVSFTAPVFTGTYTFDEKNGDKLEISSTVSLNSKYFEFTSASVKEYPDNFDVIWKGSSTLEVVKKEDLPGDLLKEGMLLLTLHVDFNLAGLPQTAESGLVLYLTDGTETSTTEESTSQSSSTTQSTSTSESTPQSSSTAQSTSQSSPTAQSTSQSSSTAQSTSQSSPTAQSTSQSSPTAQSTSQSSPTAQSTSQSSPTAQSTSQSSPTAESTSQSSPTAESTSQSSSTSSPSNDCDNNNTVWIIIVIVLFLILLAYVGATVFYYFKKIRNGRNFSELPQPSQRVEPHFQKRLSHDHKLKEVSTRRPTGFIRYNPDIEEGATKEDEEVNNNTAANSVVGSPVEKFKKISESGKNVGFKDDTPETEPTTLSDELKKAVKERESRLI